MTINGSYTASVLSNVDRGEGQETSVQIALLKKAQTQSAQQAEALIASVAQQPPCPSGCGQHLDTYA